MVIMARAHCHTCMGGSLNGNARLSEAQAQHILDCDDPTAAMSARYGVSGDTIRKIRSRSLWVHLTPSVGTPGFHRYDPPPRTSIAAPSQREQALRAENDQLRERLRFIEDEVFGAAWSFPVAWGLTRLEQRLLSAIVALPCLTTPAAMVALYGTEADARHPSIIGLMICHIRPKLARLGIRITTSRGVGRGNAVYAIAEVQRSEIKRHRVAFVPTGRDFPHNQTRKQSA